MKDTVENAVERVREKLRSNPARGFQRDELQRETELGREMLSRALAFLVLTNQATETLEPTGAPGVSPMIYRIASKDPSLRREAVFRADSSTGRDRLFRRNR